MARMLPPFVAESTQSAAERKLFVVLQDELSDEWTVLHSLGSTLHDRKPWAEIDFVLVGPAGVYCLEVKGGRVAAARRSVGVHQSLWGRVDQERRTLRTGRARDCPNQKLPRRETA